MSLLKPMPGTEAISMNRKTKSVSKGLRIVVVTGIALVLLGAYGAVGGARAAHSSCGTYCWNVYAPYTGSSLSWSSFGSAGYQWNDGPYATASNGQFIDNQQSSASNSYGGLYTYLLLQGDTIHFYTEVGVTYTFSVLVEGWYTISGWCDPPFGSYGGIATLTVVAGLVGTSISTSSEPINADQSGDCDILAPHGQAASPSDSPHTMNSGGWGGYPTLTFSVWIAAGYYTPYVEVIGYTYADAQLLAGVTSDLNFGSGGYYVQWTGLNINWGPGEG